jgi:hypothetical protein
VPSVSVEEAAGCLCTLLTAASLLCPLIPTAGGATTNKCSGPAPDNGYKKQKTTNGTKGHQDLKAMKSTFMVTGSG